jgi:hypothetical protein
MSEIPFKDGTSSKSLWLAAAIILGIVFAPAAFASLLNLLRH